MLRRSGLIALAAVVGPGVLAGLSDDDPAGITTYSILGADYGYRLLWVLLVSTLALMVFHELGMRMGVATGQGLAGLIRERFGVGAALVAVTALVIANLGTTCAEFAGVAASLGLAGVTRYVSVPVAAVGVSLLVVRGGFRRVEHVLLALAHAVRHLHRRRACSRAPTGAPRRADSSCPGCRERARRWWPSPRPSGPRSRPGASPSSSRTPSTSGSRPIDCATSASTSSSARR